MRKKISFILVCLVLPFLLNNSFAKVCYTLFPEKVDIVPYIRGSTLTYNKRDCSVFAAVAFIVERPLDEKLYEENIPVLWVYKNGVKIKEFTINDIDPNRSCTISDEASRIPLCRCSVARGDYIENLLHYGEVATITLVADPLNRIEEGKFIGCINGGTTWRKVADYEHNNRVVELVGCGKGKAEVNCPRVHFYYPGGEVKVSGKLYRYNYGLVHTTLKRFPITGILKLVSEGESKIIGAESVSLQEDQNEKTFEVTGKIPSNTHSGRYTLVMEFDTHGEPISFDSVSCPIVIRPTVQETLGEGKIKPIKLFPPEVKRRARAAMTDLKIENVRVLSSCRVEITLKNAGVGLQDAVYSSNPVILKVTDQRGFRTFAQFNLSQVDPSKKFKKSGSKVVVIWSIPEGQLPMDKDLKFLVDPDRKILESNERNNSLSKHITCSKKGLKVNVQNSKRKFRSTDRKRFVH